MEPPSLPATPALQVERAVAPIAFPDPALEEVLRRHLFPPGTPGACQRQGGIRYTYNRIDLDGDRQPETLVALLGPHTCHQQGCPVLILKEIGPSSRPVQIISGFHTSLVVSESRSQGWRDLLLPAAKSPPGGPIPRLTFNGAGYASRTPEAGAGERNQPSRGVAALVLKESRYLVQGHGLSCLGAAGL